MIRVVVPKMPQLGLAKLDGIVGRVLTGKEKKEVLGDALILVRREDNQPQTLNHGVNICVLQTTVVGRGTSACSHGFSTYALFCLASLMICCGMKIPLSPSMSSLRRKFCQSY